MKRRDLLKAGLAAGVACVIRVVVTSPVRMPRSRASWWMVASGVPSGSMERK